MFKRFLATLGFLISLFAPLTMTIAQETIGYGDIITAELTDRDFEVPFNFEGKAGEVIVIEMKPVNALGDLNRPDVILLDSNGDVVGATSDAFNIGSALLAVELTSDDTYTILATRADGRGGDSVGEFTLQLINPSTLNVTESIQNEITSEDGDDFYVIRGTGGDLKLTYQKLEGEFAPEVSINRIADDFSLNAVVALSGDGLTFGVVNVPRTDDIFIVRIKEALFDFNFNEVNANYELTLTSE